MATPINGWTRSVLQSLSNRTRVNLDDQANEYAMTKESVGWVGLLILSKFHERSATQNEERLAS
jgi:hypothetical protein